MTTGIRGCENKSDTTVSVINVEHPGDSAVISAKSYSDVYAWVSQHRNQRFSVNTRQILTITSITTIHMATVVPTLM